jgi:hypothetical protein
MAMDTGRKAEVMDRRNALGLLLGTIAAGCGGGKDTGIVGRGTYFSYVSDPGDWAGGGVGTGMIAPDNTTWNIYLNPSRSSLRIQIIDTSERLAALCEFHSAKKENGLHPGLYSPVERITGDVETEMSQMDVSITGGNAFVTGQFRIHYLIVDTNNKVTNLFISFEQHSDGSSNPTAMLRGEISFQASVPTTGA